MSRAARLPRTRVAVVTGSRAEYGLLTSAMAAIRDHPRLHLQLVVTGMHLLRSFGNTVREIERDGWKIDARVAMQRGDDSEADQAVGLARGVGGVAEFLCAARSDLVLVLGDRIEALAGALAAVTTGRVLAHIHGGDVAEGDLDESIRHAITKLAHVHFPATRAAAERIRRLGEPAERIIVSGAPGLDRLRARIAEGTARNGPSGEALVVQHAYGRPAAVEAAAAEAVLRGVGEAGLAAHVIYPNSDRGNSGVIQAIDRCMRMAQRRHVPFTVHRSLPRDAFLDLLLRVDVLVGNSSCGLIEAPFAGTPTVDVGDRQAGRQPGGPSIVHAGESTDEVRAAIERARRLVVPRGTASPYGDGLAGRRIADALAGLRLTPGLRRKRITY